jgi:hypothetical protein
MSWMLLDQNLPSFVWSFIAVSFSAAGVSFMMHGNDMEQHADDEALLMELLQTKFQAKLRDGPYRAFANANGCQFNMASKQQVNAAAE